MTAFTNNAMIFMLTESSDQNQEAYRRRTHNSLIKMWSGGKSMGTVSIATVQFNHPIPFKCAFLHLPNRCTLTNMHRMLIWELIWTYLAIHVIYYNKYHKSLCFFSKNIYVYHISLK
jgi:hypothetical protein